MGVQHYRCASCDEHFDSYSWGGSCQSCDEHWCEDCDERKCVEKFVYDGEERCTLCWEDTPAPVTDEALLKFALQKLGTERAVLQEEFLQTATALYREPRDVFECTQCPPGKCPSRKCDAVGQYFTPDMPMEDDDIGDHRGYCCAAQERERHAYCDACNAFQNKQVALAWLVVHRRAPGSWWGRLPKAVLRYCIIEPWILPARVPPLIKEKRQNKKKRQRVSGEKK